MILKIKDYKKVKFFNSTIDFLIGDCGAGKSTYASKIASQYLKKGYPVYSNLYLEGCRKIVIEDFMRYDLEDGAVIIFDEGATYGLASRGDNYKKNNTQNVIEFFTTYRHYKIERIVIIAPSFQDIIPIVRSRVKLISVVRESCFLNTLFLPVNFILKFMKKDVLRFSSIKYITKKIDVIGDMKKGSASEPKEVYKFVPFKINFFCQNFYYKYFNSFVKKELPTKKWSVYGD